MTDLDLIKGDYYEVEIGEGKRAVYRYGGPGGNWEALGVRVEDERGGLCQKP